MRNQKGFTLIELLLVIAIIGILTTFLMANFIGAKARARDAQRKSDLKQIQSALEMYRYDQGQYPTSLTCGSPLATGNATYMQKVPCDPMNTGQFIYTYITAAPYTTYKIVACLENVNDAQKDKPSNNSTYCTGGSTNWSYTVTNP